MNFPLWGVIPHNSNASTTPLSPNTVEKTLCQIEIMLEEVYFHYIYLAHTEKHLYGVKAVSVFVVKSLC